MKPNAMTNKRNYKQDFDNHWQCYTLGSRGYLFLIYSSYWKYGLIFYPRYFKNGSLELG